jgi:hypothetical protein
MESVGNFAGTLYSKFRKNARLCALANYLSLCNLPLRLTILILFLILISKTILGGYVRLECFV